MRILAIDPGTVNSAVVETYGGLYQTGRIIENKAVYGVLVAGLYDLIVLEFIQNYGMGFGRSVIDTIAWCGKFERDAEIKGLKVVRVARPTVKAHVTGTARSKDPDVRRALMQRYGGTKKGEPLHGVVKDQWAALALATYAYEAAQKDGIKEW
jgi:hypothetical protein